MMDDNHLAAKDSKTRQNVLKLKKGVSEKKSLMVRAVGKIDFSQR